MPETVTKPTLLEDLQQRRQKVVDEWDRLVDERETKRAEFEAREQSKDQPSDEERDAEKVAEDEFRATSEDLEAQINGFDERIADLKKKAERRAEAEKEQSVQITGVKEPMVYRKDNAHEFSYYRDLICSDPALRGKVLGDWTDAEKRLHTHGRQMEEILPQRETERERAAEEKIDGSEREFRSSFPGLNGSLEASPFERRVNPSRETGHGGEFVPPLWLVEDDFIPQLRAGRVIAPLCRNLPVPPGTDTIKLPKVKTGTEVAPQLADNAGVASRDVESTFVEAAVKTLAGQEDVAIQLIEQSPGQVFDRVVQEDLLADYNLKVDQNVSFGQGTNYTTLNAGTIKGLFPQTNWGAGHREAASASISPQLITAAMGANWSHIAKERFNVQNVHHVLNPAFGAYYMSATDSASELGRMFVESSSIPSFNAGAITPPENEAEGFLGITPIGPRIYISANIPPILPQGEGTEAATKALFASNKAATELLTSGTGYSYCLTAKFDDIWFFESDLRTRVLPEVVSGTLQIRFQVYAYVSLLVRYSPSLQFAGGKPFETGSMASAPAKPTLGEYAF